MIYTVKRIEEDLDFGCEERPKGMPVMAIVTLTNSSGEEIRIKAEDAMLYECNINEGDKVCFDANKNCRRTREHIWIKKTDGFDCYQSVPLVFLVLLIPEQ